MMKVLSLLLLPTLASSFAGVSTMSVQQLTVGKGKTNVIAGATGYIGKSVVRESVRQGYKTIALVRDKSKVESADGKLMYGGYFDGAELVECDVCNPSNVEQVRVHWVFAMYCSAMLHHGQLSIVSSSLEWPALTL